MFANNNQSQSATTVDLNTFRGRGEQPRTMFVDEVTGHLVRITLRAGEYEVINKDGQPVIDPATGRTMMRPNSAIAEWRSDDGERVFTNWPARYDESHNILLWDAFDTAINLAVDHLHFEKETTTSGRVFYSLTRVEAQAEPPRAQQFVQQTHVAPWDYEG